MIDLDQWFWQHFQERSFSEGGEEEGGNQRTLIFKSNHVKAREEAFYCCKKNPPVQMQIIKHIEKNPQRSVIPLPSSSGKTAKQRSAYQEDSIPRIVFTNLGRGVLKSYDIFVIMNNSGFPFSILKV
jgi:hypothetical protein